MTNCIKCDEETCICITPHPSEDDIVPNKNITVKFRISETQIIAQVYPNCKTIAEIKNDIGNKFEIDPKYLLLNQFGENLSDDCILYEACSNEFGIVELCLEISECAPVVNGKQQILDIQIYYNKFRLADFITVHVISDDPYQQKAKDILVEIHNQAIKKPFVGGYKDPQTGIEYLDAFTQTGPTEDQIKTSGIYSRDTQTCSIKSKSIDTMYDTSTQAFCEKDKLIYVSGASDFIIIPRKYETYIEKRRRENRLGKIILIQRNFRRFLLERFIKRCAAEYRRLLAEQDRREILCMDRYVEKFQKEVVHKTFPKTKDDFDMLLAQVQKWKLAEINRINSMYTGGPRIAELNLLLDKEVQLLLGIEKQKTILNQSMADVREGQMLKKMSEPVKWIGYNDLIVEMDLIRTQRVRYLTSIYDEMKKKLNKSKRLEVLDRARLALVEDQNCIPAIGELLDLIDREKNLILLTKYCDPEVLRKRQQILLVDIIKYSKEKAKKKIDFRMCDTCKAIKPISDFALRTRQTTVDICNRCYDLKTLISDNSIYRGILRCIQREERRVGTLTSYAFLLQADDIRHIVIKIWHSHSILSKDCEPSELRLPRWIKSEDWSPWNCVCLTELEARNHTKVTDLCEIYDANIIKDIRSKHLLAKVTFKRLQDAEYDYVESGEWWDVGVKDKVL